VVITSDDGTRLGLVAVNATRRGARIIGRPARDLAVDGAGILVARSGGREDGADNATVVHISNDGTRLGLGTSAARLGAGTVSRPTRDLAVNGASLGVANTVFRGRAVVTTVILRNINVVGTRLHTATTSLGARGPRGPRVFAVDRARVGVAVLLSRCGHAHSTTELAGSDYRLGAGLDTTTAKFRASGPGSPARQFAIDRTSEGVAGSGRRQNRALLAAKRSGVDDRTGLGLGTGRARLGAGTVGRPARHLAINGAKESVASGGSRESGTGNTAVSSSVHNRTRLGLGTSATGLGASTIARPAGDLAINGASESVARGD
jgi:hypothetical protein